MSDAAKPRRSNEVRPSHGFPHLSVTTAHRFQLGRPGPAGRSRLRRALEHQHSETNSPTTPLLNMPDMHEGRLAIEPRPAHQVGAEARLAGCTVWLCYPGAAELVLETRQRRLAAAVRSVKQKSLAKEKKFERLPTNEG